MTKNIIPSDAKKIQNPGKNNLFNEPRQANQMEKSRTKQLSIKHENPEFFKRQTDRKKLDSNGFQPKQFSKGTMC